MKNTEALENPFELEFSLEEVEWKERASSYPHGLFGYLEYCDAQLLRMLVNYFDNEVADPINYMPVRACEMAHEALQNASNIHNKMQKWYFELLDELLEAGKKEARDDLQN